MIGGKEKILSKEINEKFVKVNIQLEGFKKTIQVPFSDIESGAWINNLIPDDIFYENYWMQNIGKQLVERDGVVVDEFNQEKDIYESSLNKEFGWSPFDNPILHPYSDHFLD